MVATSAVCLVSLALQNRKPGVPRSRSLKFGTCFQVSFSRLTRLASPRGIGPRTSVAPNGKGVSQQCRLQCLFVFELVKFQGSLSTRFSSWQDSCSGREGGCARVFISLQKNTHFTWERSPSSRRRLSSASRGPRKAHPPRAASEGSAAGHVGGA